MVKIIYRQADGSEQTIEVAAGNSVMQGAVSNGVNGILGDCGGACQCATCHVYIGAPWQTLMPPPGEMEDAMLESSSAPRLASSRLACEVCVTAHMDGMLVLLPERQF